MTTTQEWRINRRTHSWVTLDGENYSCSWCDTKTGSEPCPEGQELNAQIDDWYASKTERETPGTGIVHADTYEADQPDPF